MNTLIIIAIIVLGLGLVLVKASKGKTRAGGGEDETTVESEESIAAKEQLKQDIKKADDKVEKEHASVCHLPPLPFNMVGRKAEIAKVIGPEVGTLFRIGLYGKSGIGKTTFGAFIAQRLAPHYPNAQIYIDLKGNDPKPVSASAAMAKILTVFHPTKPPPQEKSELESLYRSTIAGERILLFLDNASSSNQVNLLLPEKGTGLTIFTSRKILNVSDSETIKLDVLDAESSSSLLTTIAPRLGVWSKEIGKLCRNIPMALVLSGSYASLNTKTSPDEYSQVLREERNRLGGKEGAGYEPTLGACFNISYKSLEPGVARVLRKLVVFPNSFTAKAEEFMCADDDSAHLGMLTALGLVQNDRTIDRYFLHDQVRQYLTGRINSSERAAAQKRHATHYLTVLVTASEVHSQGEKKAVRGLKLFDLEWENIKAGQAWTSANASKDTEVARLSNGYSESGASMIRQRLDSRELLTWFKSGVEAAQLLDDLDMEKFYLVNLGQEHNLLEEFDEATDCFEQVLPLCKATNDSAMEQTVLAQLGIAAMGAGQPTSAIGYMEQYLEVARQTEDAPDLGSVLETLGRAYHDSDNSEKAIQYFQEGLEVAKKKNDRIRQWRILEKLGEIHAESENPQAATEFFEQGLSVARKLGHKAEERKLLRRLGDSFLEFGEAPRALVMFKKCLLLCRETKDLNGEGALLILMGDT
ncbi:MAG: tetratricopeptide repeat protein, partial [Nitrospinae bacterium]|nr:tetratricopeptide repeat protein [Nitrospinota bacterium]